MIHFNIENQLLGMDKRDLSGEEGIDVLARAYNQNRSLRRLNRLKGNSPLAYCSD